MQAHALAPPVPPPHILGRLLASETLLFSSDLVCLGTFTSAAGDPGFRGDACAGHTIAFPRRAVWIQHDGGRWFVADRATVPLYNRGQEYRRRAIDPGGDACEWMAFPSRVLADALRACDLPRQDAPEAPFDRPMTLTSAALYARQRQLFAAAARREPAAEIEERALTVLDLLLRTQPRAAASAVPREAIEEARRLLNLEGLRPLPLAALAERCGRSPFQLCREFRCATDMTISEYRRQIRVFRALDALPRSRDLSGLALAAGFCSHSHFTASFRRIFGRTPRQMRQELGAGIVNGRW